jgi:hypothetical protein
VEGYRLLIKTSARKELEAVGPGRADRQRVVRRIETLARDPRPQGCEKLYLVDRPVGSLADPVAVVAAAQTMRNGP